MTKKKKLIPKKYKQLDESKTIYENNLWSYPQAYNEAPIIIESSEEIKPEVKWYNPTTWFPSTFRLHRYGFRNAPHTIDSTFTTPDGEIITETNPNFKQTAESWNYYKKPAQVRTILKKLEK